MQPDTYQCAIPCRLDPPARPERVALPSRCRVPAIIEERDGAVISVEIDPVTGRIAAENCLRSVCILDAVCDDHGIIGHQHVKQS